jgi:hypothetical protein
MPEEKAIANQKIRTIFPKAISVPCFRADAAN